MINDLNLINYMPCIVLGYLEVNIASHRGEENINPNVITEFYFIGNSIMLQEDG